MNLDETVLEQIVKEIRAPKTVQSNIYQFVSEISGLLEKCELTKVSTSKLKNFPVTLDEHLKFPGGKVLQCSPINALKSKNLGKIKRYIFGSVKEPSKSLCVCVCPAQTCLKH